MGASFEIEVAWADLTAFERGQMFEQARQIENRFARRERDNVSGAFANLAVSALVFDPERDTARTVSVIPKDVTAPDDHYRDDLGVIMANALMLEGDPWTLPGVRRAWEKVRTDIATERDRTFGTRQNE